MAANFLMAGRKSAPCSLALAVICTGVMMVALDTTIITVALPWISKDLQLSDAAAAWVMNAYLLGYGGSLLLSGRLSDTLPGRGLYLIGVVAFTLSSVACGLASTPLTLILGRAAQGIAAAVVSAVALSLIASLYDDEGERSSAMGVYGFVTASGGVLGEVVGGVLTQVLSWHWIFLINIPAGLAVICLLRQVRLGTTATRTPTRPDLAGALLITSGITCAVYAFSAAAQADTSLSKIVGIGLVAAVLLAVTVIVERRSAHPMLPAQLLRNGRFAAVNIMALLWAAATFAWFVITALYLRNILGYEALWVGIAFLPAELIMAAVSAGSLSKLMAGMSSKSRLTAGLSFSALGLILLSRSPLTGQYLMDVLPAMVCMGIGGGLAYAPLLLVAMSDAGQCESGTASGIINTSFMFGGTIGVGICLSVASYHSLKLERVGFGVTHALLGGYHRSFLVAVSFAVAAALLGAIPLSGRLRALPNPVDSRSSDVASADQKAGSHRSATS